MSSASGGPSNRRGQYTSRACNECRRRRCKCDGVRPACGSCSSYGHQCSWGNESDAHRPPTKQLVETLRVKIRVLESELARLQATNKEQGSQKTEPETPTSNVVSAAGRFPTQSRPVVPSTTFARGEHVQRSPWLAYLDEHSRSIPNPPPGAVYQFIFNINPSISPNEQPQAAYHSLVCDWNRHLPMLDGIQFTRLEHDTLLDRCFKYSSCWLMSIIPHFFLHDMLRSLAYAYESPKVEHYSPLLHCSLLAHATAFSDDPLIKHSQTRSQFAERAKQLLHDEFCQLNLCLVQALAFLSEYHYGLGESELGYMYLGMSIRAVRALEFGKAEPRWSGRATRAEVSEWCFWSIYSHDKIMSLEMDMDCDLRSKDYLALNLPSVDREVDRLPWSDMAPAEQDSNTWLTLVFAESCKLVLILESIVHLHRSNALEPLTEDNRAAEINWKLDAWLSELPTELLILDHTSPTLLPHIIMVNIFYWWLVLRLHQPYYRPPPDKNAPLISASRPFGDLSDVLCDRAACKIILLVGLYGQQHGLRFFPLKMAQVVQVAGALLVKQQIAGVGHENQAVILECIAALRTIADTWECAEKYATFLQNLSSEHPPYSSTSSYPTSTNTSQLPRIQTEQPRSAASGDAIMEYTSEDGPAATKIHPGSF